MLNKKLTLRVSDPFYEKLQAYADREGIQIGAAARALCQAGLEAQLCEHAKTNSRLYLGAAAAFSLLLQEKFTKEEVMQFMKFYFPHASDDETIAESLYGS